MKDGFIKVAACSPKVVLADPKANADAIIAALHRAAAHGVRLAAFPELAMTGYTCGDLFMHELLLDSVETELLRIARETANLRLAAVIGAPIRCADKLYNCAVVISRGVILAVVPKRICRITANSMSCGILPCRPARNSAPPRLILIHCRLFSIPTAASSHARIIPISVSALKSARIFGLLPLRRINLPLPARS